MRAVWHTDDTDFIDDRRFFFFAMRPVNGTRMTRILRISADFSFCHAVGLAADDADFCGGAELFL